MDAGALEAIFSELCCRWPGHCFSPGSIDLIACQRCAGFYAGALAAVLLQLLHRRAWTTPRLLADCALLLQMIPLGYHWLPQGATLRFASGWLFAFGVVDFLWQLPAERLGALSPRRPGWSARSHAVLAAALMLAVLAAARAGGGFARHALDAVIVAGLALLVALLAANAAELAGALAGPLRRRRDGAEAPG